MPAFAIVGATRLGVEPFASFADTDSRMLVPDSDGEGFHPEHVPPDAARSGLMQEQFDAVLLLGPQDGMREGKPYG
jgi:hypothetical protein